MKTITILGVALLMLFDSACKKDSDPSKMDLLTASPWTIRKAEEKVNSSPWVDVFPFWDNCEKDDQWVFKRNLSLEYNEGPTGCAPNPPYYVQDEVTWSFAANETKIIVDNILYTIEMLDQNTLIISYSYPAGSDTYYTRVTFGH